MWGSRFGTPVLLCPCSFTPLHSHTLIPICPHTLAPLCNCTLMSLGSCALASLHPCAFIPPCARNPLCPLCPCTLAPRLCSHTIATLCFWYPCAVLTLHPCALGTSCTYTLVAVHPFALMYLPSHPHALAPNKPPSETFTA